MALSTDPSARQQPGYKDHIQKLNRQLSEVNKVKQYYWKKISKKLQRNKWKNKKKNSRYKW